MYVRSAGMSGFPGLGLNCPGDPGCPGNPAPVTLDQLFNLPTTPSDQSLMLQSLIAQAQPSGATGTGITSWLSQHAGTVAVVGGGFFALVFLSKAMR